MPISIYSRKDIKTTIDGDMVIEDGRLALSSLEDYVNWHTNVRLLTPVGGWKLFEELGTSSLRFYGGKNTRENARGLEREVERSMNTGNIFYPATIRARAVPISREELELFVFIDAEGKRAVQKRLVYRIKDGVMTVPKSEKEVEALFEKDIEAGWEEETTNKYLNRAKVSRSKPEY